MKKVLRGFFTKPKDGDVTNTAADNWCINGPPGFEPLKATMLPTGLIITGLATDTKVLVPLPLVVMEVGKVFEPSIGVTLHFIDAVYLPDGGEIVHIFRNGDWPKSGLEASPTLGNS